MLMRYIINLIFIFYFIFSFSAQNGGQYAFNVMNFHNSARVSALGGYMCAVIDDDPSIAILQPSNLNPDHHGKLVLNYVNYFSDTEYGFFSYAHQHQTRGLFTASVVYANYGTFDYSDAAGVFNGSTFSANDVMFQLGHSKSISDKLHIGANLKLVSSFFETYQNYAVGTDFSATYFNKEKEVGYGLILKNLGVHLNSIVSDSKTFLLPFSIDLGLNKKLKHAPFRFHLTYHYLQTWNISQVNPGSSVSFVRTFFNHLVVGSELLFTNNFNFRFGYNFQNRFELQPNSRPGTTGISWGVSFKLKKLKINYTNAKYHFSGTSNHLTVVSTINKGKKVDDYYRQHPN